MDVYSCCCLPDHVQFTLIHGPNIPGSYAVLFFIALGFTSITRHVHNWVELLVVVPHSSPVAHWTPSERGAHLLVSYLFAFLCSSWGSHSKYTGVVCIPSSSGSHFARTLHYDLSILGGPAQHGS